MSTDPSTPDVSVAPDDPPTEERYDILLFRPGELYRGGDPANGHRRQFGLPCRVPWKKLVELLARCPVGDTKRYPDPNICKVMRGAWVMGAYTDHHRMQALFTRTQLMGFDIDRSGDVERACAAFAPFKKVVHTTFKHSPDAPRCRVVIPLVEACLSVADFRRAHTTVRERLVAGGVYQAGDIDAAGSDACRLWYLPLRQPEVAPGFVTTDGSPLDLTAILRSLPSPPPPPPLPPCSRQGGTGALLHAIRVMAETPQGSRHNRLYALSRWLGGECGLRPEQVVPILSRAVSNSPEHAQRCARQIEEGMRKGCSR